MFLRAGHKKALYISPPIPMEPWTGEGIKGANPQERGLRTGSKQIGELQQSPTVPSVDSRDRTKGWGFHPEELWSERLEAWAPEDPSASWVGLQAQLSARSSWLALKRKANLMEDLNTKMAELRAERGSLSPQRRRETRFRVHGESHLCLSFPRCHWKFTLDPSTATKSVK